MGDVNNAYHVRQTSLSSVLFLPSGVRKVNELLPKSLILLAGKAVTKIFAFLNAWHSEHRHEIGTSQNKNVTLRSDGYPICEIVHKSISN